MKLDRETNARLLEYQERKREGRFREMFATTHEEYLEIPRQTANWLLLIDDALSEGARERPQS